MDCGDDEMGQGDDVGGRFGDEWEEGDVFLALIVVGLMIEDYAGFVGSGGCWAWWEGRRHDARRSLVVGGMFGRNGIDQSGLELRKWSNIRQIYLIWYSRSIL